MRRTRFLPVVLLLVLLLLLAFPAAAPPPIPMRTMGDAMDGGGSPLPVGTAIRTFVDGVDYSTGGSVQTGQGSFTVLTVGNSVSPGDVSDTPEIQEGANLDDEVIFAAGDFTTTADVFRETLSWSPGRVVAQDLTLGTLATTPLPIKIQAIVTRPARGGAQYVFVCNPTAGAVSLADYYLQKNELGRYDGPSVALAGALSPLATARVDLPSDSFLVPSGDALKLVYANPGGAGATANGSDIVVDRIEFNATTGGTLHWEPGNTILPDAPAPGIGRILERFPTCGDTNTASDFRIAMEPGLPPNGAPTVTINAPAEGQSIPVGAPFTIAWSMSDDIFRTQDLLVWVNITIGGTNETILNAAAGQTSVVWAPPDVVTSGVVVRVEVVDPFDARSSASRTVSIFRPTPYSLVIAALVVTVLLAFLLFSVLRRRRARRPPSGPPAPPTGLPPVAVPPPAAGVTAPGPPGKKLCPRCHTAVNLDDLVCFYCGNLFTEPPSGPP